MAKQRVWITFDLGVRGDYDRLYQWLDEKQAVEFGNGAATFEYDFKKDANDINSMLEQLRKDIDDNVNCDAKTKIYALTLQNGQSRPAGSFIFGKRKPSPWEGYASKEKDAIDV